MYYHAILRFSRYLMSFFIGLYLTTELSASTMTAKHEIDCDLCIYGGNAGGIAAACTAASRGLSVVVIETTAHPGGMTTAGLGETDYTESALVPGFAGQFYKRIAEYYRQRGESEETFWHGYGWTHEPHVAEDILKDMLKTHNVDVRYCHRLSHLERKDTRILKAFFDYAPPEADGSPRPKAEISDALAVKAKMYIDASYEGDLLAQAGCSYALGREGRSAFGEKNAGIRPPKVSDVDAYVIPGKPESGLLHGIQNTPAGNIGDGDDAIQAYNFRLCFSRKNFIPITKPEGYDAMDFEIYGRLCAEWEKQGIPMRPEDFYIRIKPVFVHPRLLKFSILPNGKADINNCSLGTTDLVGGSKQYAEADWATRSLIWKKHLRHVQGLLYFLSTDPRLSKETRAELKKWGPARDEFPDTAHWPHQLYVREARRLKGESIMTEQNCLRNCAERPIAQASYPMDSHECRRIVVNGKMATEGGIWELLPNNAYGIDFGAILPRREECTNLLVTACISASHAAYSSMRMEPVMMLLGESAAVAADLALKEKSCVQAVPYAALSRELRKIRGTSMNIINIQPFSQTAEEFELQKDNLQRLHDAGLVNQVAFVFSMEPEDAKKPFEKATVLARRFSEIKKKLQAVMPELQVGILNQSLMNHGGRRNALEGFPEIITLDGRNNHRFCPIAPNFQAYVEKMADIICSSKPDFMLVDDDFRMLLAGKGCFCSAHLERFAKKMNRRFTLEELQKLLGQTDEKSKAIGRAYEEMLVEGLCETAAFYRKALDRHCPNIRCGYCTSSEGEFAYAAKIAKVLAGNHPPMVRLNNGAYLEYSLKDYALRSVCSIIQTHYLHKEGVKDILAESDTFPHNRYSLSAAGLHQHICMSLLAGCNSLKLWIDNFRYIRPTVNAFYRNHLERHWGMYQELARISPMLTYGDVRIPLPQRTPGFFNPPTQSKQIYAADFWSNALAPLGIDGNHGDIEPNAVHCLSGEQLEFFTDDECRKLLTGRLLIDSLAAQKLIERGFAKEIGFSAYGKLPEVGFEELSDESMKVPVIGKYQSFLNVNAIAMQDLSADVRVLSWLSQSRYKGAPKTDASHVAPGAILYCNAKGGRVVTLAFPLTRDVWCNGVNFQSPERKWYFIQILRLLKKDIRMIYVENECPIFVQGGRFQEGHETKFFVALSNASLDPWEKISLNIGEGQVLTLTLLNPDGTWKHLKYTQKGQVLNFSLPAGTLPTAILSGYIR